MTEETEEQKAAALQERKERRADLPGYFVDTWAVLSWKNHVRIVVGEELYDMDAYRFAMVMSLEDAEAFANFILKRVRLRKEKDAKQEAVIPEIPSNLDE